MAVTLYMVCMHVCTCLHKYGCVGISLHTIIFKKICIFINTTLRISDLAYCHFTLYLAEPIKCFSYADCFLLEMKFNILQACVAVLLSLKQNWMHLFWSLKEGKTLNLLQRVLPLREADCNFAVNSRCSSRFYSACAQQRSFLVLHECHIMSQTDTSSTPFMQCALDQGICCTMLSWICYCVNILVFAIIRMKEYFSSSEEATVMKWQLCFLNCKTCFILFVCCYVLGYH